MDTQKLKLIIIIGPTSSGKTHFGLKLAKKFNGELISADSRKIYKNIKIGTHAPVGNWTIINGDLRFVAHERIWHLINFIEPNKTYTVNKYQEDFYRVINDIQSRQKLIKNYYTPTPIIIGGTGLYINAIKDNYLFPKQAPDLQLRKEIEAEIEMNGLEKVCQRLLTLDSNAQTIIDSHNPRRIIRALEICLKTKQPFTAQIEKGKPLFNILQIGIGLSATELSKTISKRVDEMINDGFVEEVKALMSQLSELEQGKKSDYIFNLPILTSLGYKELIKYISGEINLSEAIKLIKTRTYQYAKRQMTWFKKDKTIHWVKNYSECEKLVKNFLKTP